MIIDYENIDSTIFDIVNGYADKPNNSIEDEFLIYAIMYNETHNDVVKETLQNIANTHFCVYNFDKTRYNIQKVDSANKYKTAFTFTAAINEMTKNNIEQDYYKVQNDVYLIIDTKYKKQNIWLKILGKIFKK